MLAQTNRVCFTLRAVCNVRKSHEGYHDAVLHTSKQSDSLQREALLADVRPRQAGLAIQPGSYSPGATLLVSE